MSEDLQLSTEDKIALTGGKDMWNTHDVPGQDLPAIMMTDGPHGLRKQGDAGDHLGVHDSEPATCFPPAVGLSATWSTATTGAVAAAIGREALAAGVSVVLGPGMNIKRSPLCGRNFEYFSEDPHLTAELATAYVRGMQDLGVGCSVKHFALNNQETDRMRVDVRVDERTMQEIYLRAFRSVITRARPWTVMCSYNSVDGTLVSQNHRLLSEILREEWGYDGVVVSDWGAVVDRPAAVTAGLDLQMPADPAAEQDLREAVAEGAMDLDALDRAATRVAELIRRSTENADSGATVDIAEHHRVALDAARKAIVLLSNDGTLPLAEDDGDLAVIGHFAATPRYQGAGSSHVNTTKLSTALDALREKRGADIPFASGFVPGEEPDEDRIAEAVDLARSARTVLLFLGLGEDVESEGFDREDMNLPAEQIDLLQRIQEVNERVVVVLSNGSAVLLPDAVRRAGAVLETWLLGQAGGEAVAEVLLGEVNPSGKLAETIPERLEDVPSYLHFPGEASQVVYGEGLFVGYRGLDARGTAVAYPFGHGLSYTTFAYEDLALVAGEDGIEATLTVRNTGDRAGREVVQAYVSVPDSAVPRAPRALAGFAEVELEAGAEERITVRLTREPLEHYDLASSAWVLEPGTYRVEVGASSRDLRVAAEVEIEGSRPLPPVTADSTLEEITRIPGAEQLLASLGGNSAMLEDPTFLKMAEQIPIGRISSLAGVSREDLQRLIGAVEQLRQDAATS
ncbi:MAG: glycoside hydrolase family 3 C-terminal domain-containing protein [Brachybacterium sp.]|nr:glycoside hydrolase family 3 C-terminal domain-containing protein [Brachybacterium sp.]